MTGESRSTAPAARNLPKKNSAFELLILCVLCSFIEAFLAVVTLTFTLPPTDGAYGSMPFSHPLEFPAMSMAAVAAGLLMFPFAFLLLRRTDLARCYGRLLLPGIVIVGALPFLFEALSIPSALTVPLALIATVIAMFTCRKRYPFPVEAEPSPANH